MSWKATLFISSRLQRVAAAVLCLLAAQLAVASCTPEPVVYPVGVRVPVSR